MLNRNENNNNNENNKTEIKIVKKEESLINQIKNNIWLAD